jgi:hypothetical protein
MGVGISRNNSVDKVDDDQLDCRRVCGCEGVTKAGMSTKHQQGRTSW